MVSRQVAVTTATTSMSVFSRKLNLRDEAKIKAPGCAEFLFVVFVATSDA
jgi:hypothetical protein